MSVEEDEEGVLIWYDDEMVVGAPFRGHSLADRAFEAASEPVVLLVEDPCAVACLENDRGSLGLCSCFSVQRAVLGGRRQRNRSLFAP